MTVRRITGIALLALTATITTAMAGSEPANLALEKQSLMQYHDTGTYQKDIAAVMKEATYYLRFRINQNQQLKQPRKLALVLDIDETALSNYNDMLALDFGGTHQDILAKEAAGHDPAIIPTLGLYQYAKHNNVAVFFITERPETSRASTTKNLITAGFTDWKNIYFRPSEASATTIVAFKTQARKDIEAKGFDVAINIGDQYSDLKGGYDDMAFKISNPFYLTA